MTVALRDRLVRGAGHRSDLDHVRAEIRRIQEEYRRLPVLDSRTPDEIIGYDEFGLPYGLPATSAAGITPAELNSGDCFSYALARALGEPLLFVHEDFSRTDIDVAPY